MEVPWLTRLVFGLVQSPLIPEGTREEHLSSYIEKYSAEIPEIRNDLCVDDLVTGGENFEQVVSLKYIAIDIFFEVGFKIHKWHSNVPASEGKELVNETDQTFAKQILGVKLNEIKMLRLSSKKDKDMLVVEISSEMEKLTKQTILQKLASIYDPFGITSPTTIIGKCIYCDVCDSKILWKKTLPDWIVKKLEEKGEET